MEHQSVRLPDNFVYSTDNLVVVKTGVTQFFKKLDIGTFDLGDYLGKNASEPTAFFNRFSPQAT